MQFKGIIVSKTNPITGKTKDGVDYKSMEFLVQENTNQYQNSMVFKIYKSGDNIKYLDAFNEVDNIGMEVVIDYSAKHTEYQGKNYNNLNVFKITPVDENSNTPQETPKQESNTNQSFNNDNEDDLPF